MAIMDTKKIWNECNEKVCELIRGITKETSEEQTEKLYKDYVYRSTIDAFTQMLFTIETEDNFIKERKRIEAEVMYQNMKSTLKIHGVDID